MPSSLLHQRCWGSSVCCCWYNEGFEVQVKLERTQLEAVARDIFGEDSEAIARWTEYWAQSIHRNRQLIDSVRPLALIDFQGKRVLDVGCGTGGLAAVVREEGARYVGLDYHRHVLSLARARGPVSLVEASGVELPFDDSSFDYVAAFDVIEHLVGGYPWQVRFLRELRRVLRPLGMIFLTTPNRWYPWEAHSQLYGPQYLPVKVADRYIAWRNPAFLREHKTFAEIKMMTPRQLRRALGESQLCWLHQLPCGLDRREYLKLFPFRGLLAYLGLGWYPHAEFWGILVRKEARSSLRLKRPQEWFYAQQHPEEAAVSEFQPRLDFEQSGFGHQLGSGWYWHERDQQGFRWTSGEATAYLQAPRHYPFLEIRGYTPREEALEVRVDDWKVGARGLEAGKPFHLRYLLPFESTADRILSVTLRCPQASQSPNPDDPRELGVMIFSLELAA